MNILWRARHCFIMHSLCEYLYAASLMSHDSRVTFDADDADPHKSSCQIWIVNTIYISALNYGKKST